jgi:pimeloyl-ACP methyl ester carboxylesterase
MKNLHNVCKDYLMNLTLEVRPGRLINLGVYDNPKSSATIFLIHGMGGRGAQWREQITALQKDYTLIVPDLLGHGASTKPIPRGSDNPYSFIDFYMDLKIIFDKYAGQENIVIGHSYGGALAAYLTALNQTKISKLILITPIPCQPVPEAKFVYKLPLFIIKLMLPSLQKKFRAAAFAPDTPAALIGEENLGSKSNQLYVIKAMGNGMEKIPFLDLRPVNVPTLIILGKFDKIISNVKTIAFYEALPNRKFAVTEDAAHMLMLEQPQQTNQIIEEFIKS